VRVRLVLLAAILAGCLTADLASDRSGETPQQALAAAAARTIEAGTARIAMENTRSRGTPRPTRPEVVSRGEGVLDLRNNQGRVDIHLAGRDGGPAREADIMAIVFDHDILYTRGPEEVLPPVKPGTPPWLRIDVGRTTGQVGSGGMGGYGFFGGQLGDPVWGLSWGLEQLQAAAAVTEVGRDTVRGVAVRHYRAEVGVDQTAPRAPGSREIYLGVLRQAGISSLPVDVWLDGQGRIRKLQSWEDNGKLIASYAGPPGTAPPGAASDVATTTIEYFDFDAPVHVEIPPASQVTDFETLIPRTGR
jgi:hypothetical protein